MSPLHIKLLSGQRLANVPIAVEVIGDDLERSGRGPLLSESRRKSQTFRQGITQFWRASPRAKAGEGVRTH